MFKPFDPDRRSIIVAFNMSKMAERMILSGIMARATCDIHISPLIGSFKGQEERSYQIDKRLVDWDILQGLLHQADQQCILHVESTGVVKVGVKDYNYHVDSFSPSLGKFVEVTEEEALKQDDYTYCISSTKYYLIKQV